LLFLKSKLKRKSKSMNLDYNKLRVNPGSKVDLKDYSTSEDGVTPKRQPKRRSKETSTT